MKKVLSSLIIATLALTLCINGASAAKNEKKAAKEQVKLEKELAKKQIKKEKEEAKKAKKHAKDLAKARKNPKDVLTDAEYKEIKMNYFNADGYGDVYNCKVAQQRFCKVKDLDTGVYVLCDREVSRTQMESAKVFYKLDRCTKLN